MGGVQEGDVDSSRKVGFEEDDDISSSSRSHSCEKTDPHGGQETTTPPTAQRLLVSNELGSSNYTWSTQDNNAPPAVVVDIESNNDATAQSSMEGDRPDIGATTQEISMGNRSSDPSNNDDGVELGPISSASKSEEKVHLIPRNCMFIYLHIPS